MNFIKDAVEFFVKQLSSFSPLYYVLLFSMGAIFTVINVKLVNEKIEAKSKKDRREISDIKKEINYLKSINESISTNSMPRIFNALNDFNSNLQKIQQNKMIDENLFKELINEIKYLRQNNQDYPQANISSHPQYRSNDFDKIELLQQNQNEIDDIIRNFNNSNILYFENPRFFFLKPTSATSLGSEGVGMNAMSIVEFEEVTENSSKSSYIGFSLEDQTTYLIPNLFNGRWKQILQSDENKIFDVNGSDFILVNAAIIEGSRNGIWRLEKSGKFQ